MSGNPRTGADIWSSNRQQRFIEQRIAQVEKHLGEMCQAFGAFSRKTARLRDKGDEICQKIKDYSETEIVNQSTLEALSTFAQNFSAVQDYRDHEVKSIQRKVVNPLSQYGHKCKDAKEDLKNAFTAHEKDLKSRKNFERTRERGPTDRQDMTKRENELLKTSTQALHSEKVLEEKMESFERQKVNDLKNILMDFVNSELIFHARALEHFTNCYRALQDIDEEADLANFRSVLNPSQTEGRLNIQRQNSRSSLNDTRSSSQSATPLPVRSTTHSRQHSTSSANMFVAKSEIGRSPQVQTRTFNGQNRNDTRRNADESSEDDDLEDDSEAESDTTDPPVNRGQGRGPNIIRGGRGGGRPNSAGPVRGRGAFGR